MVTGAQAGSLRRWYLYDSWMLYLSFMSLAIGVGFTCLLHF